MCVSLVPVSLVPLPCYYLLIEVHNVQFAVASKQIKKWAGRFHKSKEGRGSVLVGPGGAIRTMQGLPVLRNVCCKELLLHF